MGPRGFWSEGAWHRLRPEPEESTPAAAVGVEEAIGAQVRALPPHPSRAASQPEAPGILSLRTTALRATSASPPPGQAHPYACALCILGAVAAMLNPYREASGGDGGDHRRAGGRGLGETAALVRSGVSGHRSRPRSPCDPVHDPWQCSETSPSWPWGGGHVTRASQSECC